MTSKLDGFPLKLDMRASVMWFKYALSHHAFFRCDVKALGMFVTKHLNTEIHKDIKANLKILEI